VYEREPGGVIQIAVWIEGDGESRRSLGHRNRTKAEQEARNIMRLREDGTSSPPPTREPATLGELLEQYMAYATHTRQGCLKTERHRRDMSWRAIVLLRWFGHDCSVDRMTRNRIVDYVRARRSGVVGDKAVRTRSVQVDLTFFKAALSWACGSTDETVPLVVKNVLAGFPIPDEPDPRRPLLTEDAVNALLAVAAGVHPLLPQLIVLVGSTGRRLGSVLGLEWGDIDFERRTITWRAELDKTRRTWRSPLPTAAAEVLRAHQAAPRGRLVFPSPASPALPVDRYCAAG
jgi:integrase